MRLNRQTWIAALRDPTNKQGREVLKDQHGHMCCLGLGLVVAGVHHHQETQHGSYRFGTTFAFPSPSQLMILGLSEPIADALARCNDGGATFAQIADFLEGKGAETLISILAKVGLMADDHRRLAAALNGYRNLTLEKSS